MKRLLLVGATGLVGQQVLRLAAADARIGRIVAPTRRPLEPRDKLENPIVDFNRLSGDAPWWTADLVICTLGTTLRLAGSAAAFRQVDYDYVMEIARHARSAGSISFGLNSALGANKASPGLYLRVKGEVERDVTALGYPSLTILRPSLLDGGPRPDKRPAEEIGLVVSRFLGPVIPRRYRAVRTDKVAGRLLESGLKATPGTTIIESEAI